jgi:hypothetical protein
MAKIDVKVFAKKQNCTALVSWACKIEASFIEKR